jgi:ABC-type branched-subunit amino acid transport system ATPase component
MLRITDLSAGYGAVPVVDGVSIEVGESEIVAVLGPNGAGKTTTLRAVAGMLRPLRGAIAIGERATHRMSPEEVAAAGVQFIPEGGGVLRGLTVLENLRLSAWLSGRSRRALAPRLERVYELFPALEMRGSQPAATLSGGERQMLALAQAVVRDSQVLLIDEASLGLAPVLVRALSDALAKIRGAGRSILLVEQNARMALELADRAYVMEKGRVVDSGAAAEVASHGRLAGLYLGDP